MEGLKEERAVSRNRVPTLATIGALRGAFHNMRGIVWQPFVLSLGVPMKSLGGLESTLDLTRIIAQPVLGGASDAFGRKRFIIARDIIALTTGVLLVLTRSWHLLFVSVVLLGFENALYPSGARSWQSPSSPRCWGTSTAYWVPDPWPQV